MAVVAVVVAVRCVAAEGRALWRRAEALAARYAPVAALEPLSGLAWLKRSSWLPWNDEAGSRRCARAARG